MNQQPWRSKRGRGVCVHVCARPRKTYLALKHAKSALKDVHDRVVDALPHVDNLVIVYPDHHKRRAVVLALALALVDGLLREPPVLARELLLRLQHPSQELDVAAAEQVVAAVHVDHPLAGLGSGAA